MVTYLLQFNFKLRAQGWNIEQGYIWFEQEVLFAAVVEEFNEFKEHYKYDEKQNQIMQILKQGNKIAVPDTLFKINFSLMDCCYVCLSAL